MLDSSNTAYKRIIKEALHIMWEGPNLNKQLDNVSTVFQARPCSEFLNFRLVFLQNEECSLLN